LSKTAVTQFVQAACIAFVSTFISLNASRISARVVDATSAELLYVATVLLVIVAFVLLDGN
jgi:hypothetical protein